MVKFRVVSKNDLTPLSRDCGIDSMWPVFYTTKRNDKCLKKTNTELLYIQNKVSYVLV